MQSKGYYHTKMKDIRDVRTGYLFALPVSGCCFVSLNSEDSVLMVFPLGVMFLWQELWILLDLCRLPKKRVKGSNQPPVCHGHTLLGYLRAISLMKALWRVPIFPVPELLPTDQHGAAKKKQFVEESPFGGPFWFLR